MTSFSPTTDTRTSVGSATGLGIAATAVAAAGTVYGAHDWTEIAVLLPIQVLVAALVYGFILPRALRKESAGGTALGLSVPALLLIVPAFWTGLPMVLGVAGILVGNAGRNARSGSVKAIAGLVLGALAVLAYVATYVFEGISGTAGFLFD